MELQKTITLDLNKPSDRRLNDILMLCELKGISVNELLYAYMSVSTLNGEPYLKYFLDMSHKIQDEGLMLAQHKENDNIMRFSLEPKR